MNQARQGQTILEGHHQKQIALSLILIRTYIQTRIIKPCDMVRGFKNHRIHAYREQRMMIRANSGSARTEVLSKLASEGRDRRILGKTNEVVSLVLSNPRLFKALVLAVLNDDLIIRIRSVDAIEKVTRSHLKYLTPHKNVLLSKVSMIEQQEVRLHFAQIVTRLKLSSDGTVQVFNMLDEFRKRSISNIVTTCRNTSNVGFESAKTNTDKPSSTKD
jgi:hypothetical protein